MTLPRDAIWQEWADWRLSRGKDVHTSPRRFDFFGAVLGHSLPLQQEFIRLARAGLERRFALQAAVLMEDFFDEMEACRAAIVCQKIGTPRSRDVVVAADEKVAALARKGGKLGLRLALAGSLSECVEWLSFAIGCAAVGDGEGSHTSIGEEVMRGLKLDWDAVARAFTTGAEWEAQESLCRVCDGELERLGFLGGWHDVLPKEIGKRDCEVGAVDWSVLNSVAAPSTAAIVAHCVPACLEWIRATLPHLPDSLARLETVYSVICADNSRRDALLQLVAVELRRARSRAREMEPPAAALRHRIQDVMGDTSGLRLVRTEDSSLPYLRMVAEHDALLCLRALLQHDYRWALGVAAYSVRHDHPAPLVLGDSVVLVSPASWRELLASYTHTLAGVGNLAGIDLVLAGLPDRP